MGKQDLSEEDIKARYITPAVEHSGWDKNHHTYFEGIAKKSYHFVQNHIFNRKIHIKIIENTVLCP